LGLGDVIGSEHGGHASGIGAVPVALNVLMGVPVIHVILCR